MNYIELRPVREPGRGIRARRSSLGLSESFVAEAARMSLSEYSDLEQDPTDLCMTVPLGSTKLTYPDGAYVAYVYDEVNRLHILRDDQGVDQVTYSYDELSRISHML